MSVTVYFANISKRRNSTLQGTFSTSYDCVLKAPTSLDRPTFLVSAASMDYNAAKMGDRYYFIDDVISVRDGQWEVSCILDVLATYKADILASTQYVTYSANAAKTWLADTRIPLLRSTSIKQASTALTSLINTNGFYVLSATGKDGCHCYMMSLTDLKNLIARLSTWESDSVSDLTTAFPLDFSDLEHSLQSLTHTMINTGVFGNAYADAPNNIRSCIWVPFFIGSFSAAASERVYLGQFDTGIDCFPIKEAPISNTFSVSIPWHFNDWRRSICEDVYLNLPFVGTVQLSADSLTHVTELFITYSATATDGVITYEVHAGNTLNRIGIYQGQCSANYPIGISQQASAGQVLQSVIAGAEKMASAAVMGSISPMQVLSTAADVAMTGVEAVYNVENARFTSNNTTIGGTGGGAGAGLTTNAQCVVIAHDTAVTPASMAATMGRPMMEAMSLASLTGFCQCANAHVAAAAQAQELDAIDTYLNSGFYIE